MAIQSNRKIKALPLALAAALLVMSLSSLTLIGRASAVASMNQTQVRLDRLKFSTLTGGRVCAKPTSTATEAKVVVTFPTNSATDYTLSATLATWAATGVAVSDGTITASAWPSLAATSATSVVGKTVTWAAGDLTVGTMYCFTFGAGLTNASNNTEVSVGNVTTQDAGAVPIDQGLVSIGLAGAVANDDQIAITNATVPPSFTFNLSGNTDSFTTNLSLASVVSTNGRNVNIATNAANGYIIWVKDSQNSGSKGALFSTTANFYLVGSTAVGSAARTLTPGTQDYGLAATIGTNGNNGALSLHANYNSTASVVKVGTLDPLAFEPIAQATGTTSADTINVAERAAISGTTKAASDYADTITVVGAGLF